MKRSTCLFSLILIGNFALILPEGTAQTGGNSGRVAMVTMARGNVQAVAADGTTRQLKSKSDIFLGDRIKTGARGRVQIFFDDETLISLGRNTDMLVKEFEFDPEENQGKLVTRVEEGIFRVMGGAITKISPENFKTETSTATIGIRGSFYSGTLFSGRLTVVFLGGMGISVANTAGRVEIVNPSFGSVVPSRNQPPGKPTRFSGDELRELTTGFFEEEEDGGEGDEQEDEDGDEDEGADEDEAPRGERDPLTERPPPEESPPPGPPAPPGGATRKDGFAVSVSEPEDSSRAGEQMHFFRNTRATASADSPAGGSDPTHFGYRLSDQEGAVTGSMSLNGDDEPIRARDILIGGNGNDDTAGTSFRSDLSDPPEGNAILSDSASAPLESPGSELMTSTEARQWSEWIEWGYWRIAYDWPETRTGYAVPDAGNTGNPAGTWVAGQLTPRSYLEGLLNSTSTPPAVYDGYSSGISGNPGNWQERVGTSRFDVDFDLSEIEGHVRFPELTDPAAVPSAVIDMRGTVTADGFSGDVTGVTEGETAQGLSSEGLLNEFQGDFFGPEVNAVGGSFSGSTLGTEIRDSGTQYIGVFGAEK